MADTTGKLGQWHSRLSEFVFDRTFCAGIKQHVAEELSRLKTKDKDQTALDDVVPVVTVSQEIFAWGPTSETSGSELIE